MQAMTYASFMHGQFLGLQTSAVTELWSFAIPMHAACWCVTSHPAHYCRITANPHVRRILFTARPAVLYIVIAGGFGIAFYGC